MTKIDLKTSLVLFSVVLFAISCSKNTLSERDMRLEQIRNNAEQKRQELSKVIGLYGGLLHQANGQLQNVSLNLEIKDIPYQEAGQVDPIMVPELTGYFRFLFGEEGSGSEYINFSIEKAEYDMKKAQLDLVLNNEQYKKLIIGFSHAENKLSGNWTAPDIGTSGTVELSLDGSETPPTEKLQGEYGGILFRDDANFYNFSHLNLKTSFQPPEGLKISGTVRIIYGEFNSKEYLTYTFADIKYNPSLGELIFKNEENDVMFKGQLGPEGISGEWYSDYTGKMGKIQFRKDTVPTPPLSAEQIDTLRGSYLGSLKNTHPESNLPEIVQISFVTSQDLALPSGLKITGKIRFYFDENLTEWEEREFGEVKYNFYTKELIAKTSGGEKLTFKLSVKQDVLEGGIEADALGEVGKVEVRRQ